MSIWRRWLNFFLAYFISCTMIVQFRCMRFRQSMAWRYLKVTVVLRCAHHSGTAWRGAAWRGPVSCRARRVASHRAEPKLVINNPHSRVARALRDATRSAACYDIPYHCTGPLCSRHFCLFTPINHLNRFNVTIIYL